MDEFPSEKIKNYLSDRIEEIKDGSYVPTYDKIKELPEFSGIFRRSFRIARKKWYWQHFGMSFFRHSKRLETIKARNISEKEYDRKRIKGKRNNGLILIITGVIVIVLGLWYGISSNWSTNMDVGFWLFPIGFGIILLLIGFIKVLYNSIKLSK